MDTTESQQDTGENENALPCRETEGDQAPAWELIDAGRYRPRRIRGSYRGRELG